MNRRWIRAIFLLGNLHRRLLGALLSVLGPKMAYRITGCGARLVYRLLDPFRVRSEAQCRAALWNRVTDEAVSRIARQSFVNRVWNLTDLTLAARLLRPDTFHRYGGRIPEPFLGRLLEAQRHHRPTILMTGYYGSFDLLPVFLGYNGIRATVIYMPHDNPGFDTYRRRIRSQSGCEMIPINTAARRLGEVLERGGTVAIVADHHVRNRGMPVTFLGVKTKALRSVGLLAWRYEADVIVAGIRRVDDRFAFELVVADVIDHGETAGQPDPVQFVTHRYLRALERMILENPAQYLWGYARWGEEYAKQAADRLTTERDCTAAPSATPSGIGNRQAEVDGRPD